MTAEIHRFEVPVRDGGTKSLAEYAGHVLLIVNTASQCGFTPQFEGLEKLHQTYGPRGLAVLGFPCNQFGNQDPGTNEEIASFCALNYGVTFPVFAKIDVNGSKAHPLFEYLKREAPGVFGSRAIKWNFTKFLVDRSGTVVKRFAPKDKPEDLAADIESLLR